MKTTTRQRSWASLTACIVISLSGCSDYPSEGVLDTRELRTQASIIDVEGFVYGVEKGTLDAYSAYDSDRKTLNWADNKAWDAHINGEALPELELASKHTTPEFDLTTFSNAIARAIDAKESEVDAEIAEELAEAQADRDKLVKQLEEVSAGSAKFDAYVADSKAAFEKAQQALDNAINAYNAAVSSPVTKINELAKGRGLEPISSRQNPLSNYRTIDFRNRTLPAACPSQRGYTKVDLRQEQKMCAYIRIPSEFKQFASQIAGFTKTAILDITKLQKQLGEKGSWRKDATGAYATLAQTEKNYKTKRSEAHSKFGDSRERKAKEQWLTKTVARAEERVAKLSSNEYRLEELSYTSPDLSDEARDARNAYLDAVRANLLSRISKLSPVALEEEEIFFGDVGSGLEGAIVVAELIAESAGRRHGISTLNYIDLTPAAIGELDLLMTELDKDSMRDARRIDIRDEETIEKAILKRLDDAAKSHAKAT